MGRAGDLIPSPRFDCPMQHLGDRTPSIPSWEQGVNSMGWGWEGGGVQRGRLVLKSGHSEFLNMLNFSF